MKKVALILVSFLFPISLICQINDWGIASMHCYSDEEQKLFNLINNYRLNHNKPTLQLSKSLSYVAKVHTKDIFYNKPHLNNCNFHSWSDKGNWQACCYSKNEKRIECMTNKPKELTNYKGKAFEVFYDSDEKATSDDVFNILINVPQFSDYLLNNGEWGKYIWKSIGISLFDNYASIWFGDNTDVFRNFEKCNDIITVDKNIIVSNSDKPNVATQKEEYEKSDKPIVDTISKSNKKYITETTVTNEQYYVIVASLKTELLAQLEAKRLKNKGFKSVEIVKMGSGFRISLNKFGSESEAQELVKKIKDDFKGAWVFNSE